MPTKSSVEKPKSETPHLNPSSQPQVSGIAPDGFETPMISPTGLNAHTLNPRTLPSIQRTFGNQAASRMIQTQRLNHSPIQASPMIQRQVEKTDGSSAMGKYKIGRVNNDWIPIKWEGGDTVQDLITLSEIKEDCLVKKITTASSPSTSSSGKKPVKKSSNSFAQQQEQLENLSNPKETEKIVGKSAALEANSSFILIPALNSPVNKNHMAVLSSLSRLARTFGKKISKGGQEAQAIFIDGKIVLTGNSNAETAALAAQIPQEGSTASQTKTALRSLFALSYAKEGLPKELSSTKGERSYEDLQVARSQDLKIVEDWIDLVSLPDEQKFAKVVSSVQEAQTTAAPLIILSTPTSDSSEDSSSPKVEKKGAKKVEGKKKVGEKAKEKKGAKKVEEKKKIGGKAKLEEKEEVKEKEPVKEEKWHAEQKLLLVLAEYLKREIPVSQVAIAGVKYPCNLCKAELALHKKALKMAYPTLKVSYDKIKDSSKESSISQNTTMTTNTTTTELTTNTSSSTSSMKDLDSFGYEEDNHTRKPIEDKKVTEGNATPAHKRLISDNLTKEESFTKEESVKKELPPAFAHYLKLLQDPSSMVQSQPSSSSSSSSSKGIEVEKSGEGEKGEEKEKSEEGEKGKGVEKGGEEKKGENGDGEED